MSSSFRERVEVLLQAFEEGKTTCRSSEEIKEKLSLPEEAGKEERFKAVVEALCKLKIWSEEDCECEVHLPESKLFEFDRDYCKLIIVQCSLLFN